MLIREGWYEDDPPPVVALAVVLEDLVALAVLALVMEISVVLAFRSWHTGVPLSLSLRRSDVSLAGSRCRM